MKTRTTPRLALTILGGLSASVAAWVLCVRAAPMRTTAAPSATSKEEPGGAAPRKATAVSEAQPSQATNTAPVVSAAPSFSTTSAPSPADTEEDASPPFPGAPRTPEELARERELLQQALDAKVFAHTQEPVDWPWARDASERVRQTLTNAPPERTPEARVECRSTSCFATLKYRSFAEASADLRRLTTLPEGLNCAVHAEAAEPRSADDAGTARVLYEDCVL